MFRRILAFALCLSAVWHVRGQEVVVGRATETRPPRKAAEVTRSPDTSSAWIDLRQTSTTNKKAQTAPEWVRAVRMFSSKESQTSAASTTFRIELAPPAGDFQVLSFRLFFDDKSEERPRVNAADESGDVIWQTPPLGLGLNVATSETVIMPIGAASTIDVEVPGNGEGVRAAFLDWMKSTEVLRPLSGDQRFIVPESFGATTPLHAPKLDAAQFGTVTATLAPETMQIGPTVPQGAGFRFGIESQPLAALLTFELGSAQIEAPPEVYLNGEGLGPVTLSLPDLSDPGYRGEVKALVRQMRFQYTGWVRAQKLIPASSLRVGSNDLLVVGGAGTAVSAIRATQIQLKYVWEKLDYHLIPRR
ncbi:MAG: hypothetical protein H0X04_05220 [Chthoniobacterales bacterium]|nr:hypothetical protein [Chthoniobacterales bacterium]